METMVESAPLSLTKDKLGRFIPGVPTNPAGKPKGTLNRVTIEVREMSRKLISSPYYVKKLRQRINAGEANHMEPILWYYAYGKPVDRVEQVDGNGNTISPFLALVQIVQAAGLTSRDGAERFLSPPAEDSQDEIDMGAEPEPERAPAAEPGARNGNGTRKRP